jgi:hypothetical protein
VRREMNRAGRVGGLPCQREDTLRGGGTRKWERGKTLARESDKRENRAAERTEERTGE